METSMDHPMHHTQYWHLLIMVILSFIAMYILMYAMVDRFTNIYSNFNQFYMAALMTASMIIIELTVMRGMYVHANLNVLIIAVSVIVLITSFLFIRRQVAIGDAQFLKSMIPHHAAAILMCEQAPIQDPAIVDLCERIISNQQSEIDEMKGILN
jgi:hypothetical protein